MCNINYCILVILTSDLLLVSVEIIGNYRSHFYLACFSRAANHPQPVEGSPYKPQRPPAAPPSPAAYANYPPNHNSLRYVQQQSPYGTTVPYRENPYSVRTPVSSSIQAPYLYHQAYLYKFQNYVPYWQTVHHKSSSIY